VSFTEQGRSLIAGQDPLRVLKEVCFVGIFSLVSFLPIVPPQTFPDAQKANTLVFCIRLIGIFIAKLAADNYKGWVQLLNYETTVASFVLKLQADSEGKETRAIEVGH
jgi:hypothetical protein